MKQPKGSERLTAEQIAHLAGLLHMSVDDVRKVQTETLLRPEPTLSYEEEEELQFDLEEERWPFVEACSQHNLLNRLNGRERRLLWRVWTLAQTIRFLVSGPLLNEESITHHESIFVRLRRRLFSTKGWKALPERVKADVEARLFAAWEDPWCKKQ